MSMMDPKMSTALGLMHDVKTQEGEESVAAIQQCVGFLVVRLVTGKHCVTEVFEEEEVTLVAHILCMRPL